MLREMIQAAFLIFVAEMGDKTQILAMTFALKYSVGQVLGGVFAGAFLNHGLAVLLGAYLSNVVPLHIVRIFASFVFIGFGLWTLAKNEEDEDEDVNTTANPILTVALAFFIGELGDKTQLTAIALSSNAQYPLFILLGTTLGMVLTSAVGIFVGSRLGSRIPAFPLKIASSSVFLVFGVLGLANALPRTLMTTSNILVFAILLISLTGFLFYKAFQQQKAKQAKIRRIAGQLLRRLHEVHDSLEQLCLSEQHCGRCQGDKCPIGHCKHLLAEAIKQHNHILDHQDPILSSNGLMHKDFDQDKLLNSLKIAKESCFYCPDGDHEHCVFSLTSECLQDTYEKNKE